MPLTKIDLDQSLHIGSSGTFVSDEELIDASGFLQAQIPDVLNDLDDVILTSPITEEVLQFNGTAWVNASVSGVGGGSGVTQVDVINIITNNITGIASGVASLIRFDLPLNADDDDVNHTTVSEIPVAEYNTAQKSRWNLKTPVGGVSGIEFDFSWFSEVTETAAISFDVKIRELPVGEDVTAVTPIVGVVAESDTFTTNIIRNNTIKLGITIPGLQDISVTLERNSDSLNGKIRMVSYGVIYKASGVS